MSSYLVLSAIGLLVIGTIFAFLAAGSILKLKSSAELKEILETPRSSAVRTGAIGLVCIVASAVLYQLSVSTGTPNSVFDCALGRPFAPTTLNCVQRGDDGEVSWVVKHHGSTLQQAKGNGVTFSVQEPGEYLVESIVKAAGFLARSGSSMATIKVQEPPPPQYVSRSIPFSISVSSPKGEAEQSFQVGLGERITNANIQLHSSLPVSARIKSQTDREVVVQVQSYGQCDHGPFGNCLNANVGGRAEGTLNLTIARDSK